MIILIPSNTLSPYSSLTHPSFFNSTSSCSPLSFRYIKLFMSTKYKIGQEAIVSTKEIADKRGVVRFVGKIEGKA